MELKDLLPYCITDRQREVLTALIEEGSVVSTGKKLGVHHSVVTDIRQKLEKRAALQNGSLHANYTQTPDGYGITGASGLYDPTTGESKLVWIKTNADKARLEALAREWVAAASEGIPREKPVKQLKTKADPDLLNLIVITDYHFGMLAWGEETRGDDWDADIAEDLLTQWFASAIDKAPAAGQALLCFLGDDMHFDGLDAVTPASKHLLDADTRFSKIVRLWIRVRRRVNQMLLRKYPTLHLISAEGNHDPVSSIWMREWMAAMYENEPRVTVDQSVDPYYCYEWGDVSLFFHHGHKRKPSNVHDVFASKFRELFGRTKYSYGHMGHLHHREVKESNLMIVEQHRTLAAADAYASRMGFNSGRDAQVITYHKQYGEVGRVVIPATMVQSKR